MDRKTVLLLCLLACSWSCVLGVPKNGIFKQELFVQSTVPDPKAEPTVEISSTCVDIGLFKGSTISVSGNVKVDTDSLVKITMNVYKVHCANLPALDCSTCPPVKGDLPNQVHISSPIATSKLNRSSNEAFTFMGVNTTYVEDSKTRCMDYVHIADIPEVVTDVNTTETTTTTPTTKTRRSSGSTAAPVSPRKEEIAVNITVDGGIFVIQVHAVLITTKKQNKTANITLNYVLANPHGYLSAVDFPALVFYGVLTGVYALYAIGWLVALALNYTDLVRLQFWVLSVVLLGFLEKALFLAEYDSVNQGNDLHWLIVIAVVVSAIKRSLSRMLLVIVALGYGTVKPRLGDSLTKVIAAGVLYGLLAAVNGILRARNETAHSNDTSALLSYGLLIFVDVIIMYWIFASIVETRRALRVRKNFVKLAMYNHFAYALIFSILAALGFVIWDLFAHIFPSNGCLKDWGEVWLHDCFWHVLFAIILGIVMVIWRPSANKTRFSYSLVDNEDDDEEDEMEQGSNKNFESVKMRQVAGSTSEPPPPPSSQAEEDLRWVEENLPTSAIDKALPLLLDSDEELMTTKFENSKIN